MTSRKRDSKPTAKAGKGKPRAGASSPATVPAATPGMQQIHAFMQGMDQAAQSNAKNAFLYFAQSIVGKPVHVKSKDGFTFDGVFSVLAPRDDGKSYFVFKGVRPKSGTPPPSFENGAVLVVDSDKIAQVSVASVNLQVRHRPDGLSTDSEIGKKDLSHLVNRELKAADTWLNAPAATSLDLDDSKAKGWDQFKVNEQLFDVKTSFDENLYTTRLDKSKFTAAQEQEAARIAKLIESQRSSNIHLAEERGQVTEHELDEEDLYSGVARTASDPNDTTKYRPPSQRKHPAQKVTKKATEQTDGTTTPRSEGARAESPKSATSAPTAAPTATTVTSAAEPIVKDSASVSGAPETATAAKKEQPQDEKEKEKETKKSQDTQPDATATAAASAAGDAQPATTTTTPGATEEKPAEKKKSTLNPSAKEFHFNPNAREFTPPVAAAPQPVPAPVYPPTSMASPMMAGYGPAPPMPVEPVAYPPYEMYDPNMMMQPMPMSMEEQYAAQYYGYAPGGMPPPPAHMDPNYMPMQPMYMPQPPPHMYSAAPAGYPPHMSPAQHHRHPNAAYGSDERRGGYGGGRGGRGRPRTGSVGNHSDSGRR